jgi:serine/threonine-protein kinase
MDPGAYPLQLSLPVARGEVLAGRYVLGPILGEGGMGVVIEAHHLALDVPIAIKLIRSDLKNDEEFVLRFVNEARAAALLKGDHIARVYDVGQLDSGEPYLVMERLEGVGLEEYLKSNGPLEADHAVALALEVCEGLAEAHAVSLVHRDIKPANLFLSHRPEGRSVVKILDFGIAKRLVDRARCSLTNPAKSLGSPWYMSPEQMADPSRVDQRADIWSLGVLIYELLTNEHPFDGEGIPEVCGKVLSASAPSLSDVRPDIDPELDAVVRRCLEKDPDDRFQTVRALAESLAPFAGAPTSSLRPVELGRSWRRRSRRSTVGSLEPIARHLGIRRKPRSWLVAATGACALLGALAGVTLGLGPIPGMPKVDAPIFSRLRLPWDPILGEGPDGEPLASLRSRAPLPLFFPLERTQPLRASAAVGVVREPVEPLLTPAEIRRRTARYEEWLRAQGLERVERASVRETNPY